MAQPAPPVQGATVSSSISWSAIDESAIGLEKLRLLCHSGKELKKEGYVVTALSLAQIESKLRCMKCGTRGKKRGPPRAFTAPKQKPSRSRAENHELESPNGEAEGQNEGEAGQSKSSSSPSSKAAPPHRCAYHTGSVIDKFFSCCNKHVSQPGCTTELHHAFPSPNDPYVRQHWQYHATPERAKAATTPASSTTRKKGGRRGNAAMGHGEPLRDQDINDLVAAVALDCEMGTSINNEPELIRLTAVNFFTGAILVDNLVSPTVALKHYNTRYSGVTPADMRKAVREGTCIFGRDKARELLWRHVGPETVAVVHGGSNDFSALRWTHPHVVDTHILESYTGVRTEGGRSLQNLCRLKLGIEVQQRNVPGRTAGHDSLEDSMACRELAVDWIGTIPGF